MCDTTQFGKCHTCAVPAGRNLLSIQTLAVGQGDEIIKDADGVGQHQTWL